MLKNVAGLSKIFVVLLTISCSSYKPSTQNISDGELEYSYELLPCTNKNSHKYLIYVPFPDTLSITDNIDFFKPYLKNDFNIIKLNKYDNGGLEYAIKQYDTQNMRNRAFANILTSITSDTTAELHLLAVGPEVTGILPVASGINFKSMVLIDPWIKSPSFNFNYIYYQENSEQLDTWIHSSISTKEFLENVYNGEYNDYSFGPYKGLLWKDIWYADNTKYLDQIKCPISIWICMNRPYRAKLEKTYWDEWKYNKKGASTVQYYPCSKNEAYTDLNLLIQYINP